MSTSTTPAFAFLAKLLSFPVFLGVLLVAGVFATVCLNLQEVQTHGAGTYRVSIFEGDTWYHILEGQKILNSHTWPTTDSYSFTAHGSDSIAFEWLGQVLWALAEHLGGLRVLTGLLLALASVLMVLLYVYAYLRCGNTKAAFLASAILLPLASAFFTLRPQLLGYIFLLLTLIAVERFRQGHRKTLWFLPLLFVVWVNTHGSFVLGLGVLVFYWAAGLTDFRQGSLQCDRWTPQQSRTLLLIILLCSAALAVTPYGTRIAGFTIHVILNAPLGMAHIVEYKPLGSFGELLKPFLILLLLFIAGLIAMRPRYRLPEIALFFVAVFGACVHVRLLLFFVFVFAPLAAVLLAQGMPERGPQQAPYLLNAALMLLICAGMVRFYPSTERLQQVVTQGFPSGAVEYLKRHPVSGPMFNDDFWGAYLVRSLGLGHKVFIDGRSQLYEESGVFADYLHVIQVDRDTPSLLRKYGIQACLIERDAPLATYLAALPDWTRVYQDPVSSLFVRKLLR